MGTIPVETLDLMKAEMPKGWGDIIADRTEYSQNYVFLVMRGERDNERIIGECRKLIRNERERLDKLNKDIINDLKK